MLKVTRNETPARSVPSKWPDVIAISRLPSHGLRFGSPPKLQGHEMVQLQLSATVAIRCQFGSAARGGAVVTSAMIAAARLMRIMGHSVVPSLPACQSKSAMEHGHAGLAIVVRPRRERDRDR